MDALDTVNRSPDTSSFILSSVPVDPLTSRTVDPELYSVVNPITSKLPEIIADPVYGNVVSGAYDAESAWVAYDAVPVKSPINEPENDPVKETPDCPSTM